MRPPICAICHATDCRDTVSFADYVPLPAGLSGHPHGLEWFCPRHLDAAERWSGLPVADALKRIGRR